MGLIPYGRQSIDDADVRAVVEVLRSDFLTQGPAVPRFEKALADYCGAPHAVAANSGTSALHIACLALGVGPGDRVWTSPNTFVASANCARYCGAEVDFVDIDPRSYNLSPQALAARLERAERERALPKVVIPVHFGGLPCDMAAIHALRERYRFRIIEDASHAIGARYADGGTVGNGRYSDITVFSFHPVKIVTTAEGGAAATRDAELARRMQLLRSHGVTREAAELEKRDEGAWYYEQHALGFNYRMTDVHAVLGLSQMQKIETWIARRQQIAAAYDGSLARLPLILPHRGEAGRSALHLYAVQVDPGRGAPGRRIVFDRLRDAGIGVNVHYIPVYRQPYYRARGAWGSGYCPNAESYYARALTLPLYASMSDAQQDAVVRALGKALAA